MRVAREVRLSDEQRASLERIARSRTASVRFALRAKMVLMAAEGMSDVSIASQLNVSRQAVARWRGRFASLGIGGIEKDAPRPGRKPKISVAKIQRVVRMTTQEKPSDATHWSTRSMARASGLSEATVRRIWKKHGLKPHLVRNFKLSNDPLFAEKVEDIVGLYLNPPEHALVLCADEKSQVQALDRTQPGLPMKKGRCGTMTHDYKRNGTTTLFAALSALDGKIIATCAPRHRHQEWLKFLRLIDKSTPSNKQIHLVIDNYSPHKHPAVQSWMRRHPRFHVHFTPTSASWLNMVERFFRDLTQKQLKRGVFSSAEELIAAIYEYIGQHNENPKPFIWTAKASDILEKVKRARTKLDKLSTV
jgi:transposase